MHPLELHDPRIVERGVDRDHLREHDLRVARAEVDLVGMEREVLGAVASDAVQDPIIASRGDVHDRLNQALVEVHAVPAEIDQRIDLRPLVRSQGCKDSLDDRFAVVFPKELDLRLDFRAFDLAHRSSRSCYRSLPQARVSRGLQAQLRRGIFARRSRRRPGTSAEDGETGRGCAGEGRSRGLWGAARCREACSRPEDRPARSVGALPAGTGRSLGRASLDRARVLR